MQVQLDRWDLWDAHEDTGKAIVTGLVAPLAKSQRDAVWLQSEAGFDWDWDHADDDAECPSNDDDIVDYLWREHVLDEAGRWSNPRIRAYLDRQWSD